MRGDNTISMFTFFQVTRVLVAVSVTPMRNFHNILNVNAGSSYVDEFMIKMTRKFYIPSAPILENSIWRYWEVI